jgi:hypothetical protein
LLYYRRALSGFGILVDGQVMTAFGIFIQNFLQFRVQYLPEMFGITRSSRRYHRLGKLFMLLLTSGEMKKRLCDILRLWLHEPAGIQTTSITVHEEGKTDRGALVGPKLFRDRFGGKLTFVEGDDVVEVGAISAADFIALVSRFVNEVDRMKP